MQRSVCSVWLWALLAFVLPFASCSHSSSGNVPQCVAPPPTATWPSNPSALTPKPARTDVAFVPAQHAAFPVIPKGATELSMLRLVTVVAEGDPLRDTLFAFSDALVTSSWLAETGMDYGVPPRGLSIHLDGPPLSGNVTIDDMRSYVNSALDDAPQPADETLDPHPDGHTVYMLFLPPGVNAQSGNDVNCDCNAEAGAHTTFNNKGDALAFSQRCAESDTDLMTRVASHEVMESLTDPVPGQGYVVPKSSPPWTGSQWAWSQEGDVEVADLCTGTRITQDTWTYQRIWSNSAAKVGGDPCVPALTTPYFNTSVAQPWLPIAAGQTVGIAVNAWSTAPRPDWYVYPAFVSSVGFSATLTTATKQILTDTPFYSLNNGDTATLTVTAPNAPSGTFDVVNIVSRSADSVDGVHFWPVGVYIP